MEAPRGARLVNSDFGEDLAPEYAELEAEFDGNHSESEIPDATDLFAT